MVKKQELNKISRLLIFSALAFILYSFSVYSELYNYNFWYSCAENTINATEVADYFRYANSSFGSHVLCGVTYSNYISVFDNPHEVVEGGTLSYIAIVTNETKAIKIFNNNDLDISAEIYLDPPITIYNQSIINTTVEFLTNGSTNVNIDYVLVDKYNNQCFYSAVGSPYINAYCTNGYVDYGSSLFPTPTTFRNEVITLGSIFNGNTTTIDKIMITAHTVSATNSTAEFDLYIYNITFGNYSFSPYGSNSLPICEYNISNIVCFNGSQDYTLDIDLQCTDEEGDTIYYSTEYSDIFKRALLVDEDFSSYSFFTSGYFNSNYSYSEDYHDSELYIGGWTIVPYSILGSLGGNNILITDNGVSEWTYTFEENYIPSQEMQVAGSFIIGFPDDDTDVEIEFIDGLGSTFENITMYQNGDNMTIYNSTSLLYNEEKSLMQSDYTEYWTFSWSMTNETIVILIEDYDYNNINYSRSININSFKGFRFKTVEAHPLERDFWVMDNLIIHGWNWRETPSFTTTKPTSVTISTDNIGQVWTLYVSDVINQPTSYNTYQEYITLISDCEDSDIKGAYDDDNIIGGIRNTIRSFLDNLNTDNYNTVATLQNALWIFYLVLLVILVWTMKTIKVPFLLTNIAFLGCAFVFGSISQLLSGVILLSISIVIVGVLK